MLKSNSSLKQNSRGCSVGTKNPFLGLRSIEPKFIKELVYGQSTGFQQKKNKMENRQVLVVKKQNLPPEEIKAPIEPFSKTKAQKFAPSSNSPMQAKYDPSIFCYVRGLHNIGNTCYMNSTLQCLLHQSKFNTLVAKEIKKFQGKSIPVSSSYFEIIRELSENKNGSALNLQELKKNIGKKKPVFFGSAQHDAQQFLTSLLEIFNSELSRVTEKPKYRELDGDPSKKSIKQLSDEWWNYYMARDNSVVCDIFQGQLISIIECKKCELQSVNFDNFWELPITLQKYTSISEMIANHWSSDKTIDSYSCSGCQKTRNCTRTVQLFRLPQILTIQLKRFEFSRGSRKKKNDEIEVDKVLDLSSMLNVCSNEEHGAKYVLKGMIHHYGQAQFGHYTATIYCDILKQWFCMNDSSVELGDRPNSTKTGYLFFYERAR